MERKIFIVLEVVETEHHMETNIAYTSFDESDAKRHYELLDSENLDPMIEFGILTATVWDEQEKELVETVSHLDGKVAELEEDYFDKESVKGYIEDVKLRAEELMEVVGDSSQEYIEIVLDEMLDDLRSAESLL